MPETAIYQLPRRLGNRVIELVKYLKDVGYTIIDYRSWESDEDELFLSITSGHQINMDEELPSFFERIKAERVKLTWRVG